MKTRILIIAIAILFVPVLLSAQKKQAAKHRVVIQFNDMDSVSQVRAVRQVENIRTVWPDAEIEMVCLSGGLDLLTTKNSKASQKVTELSQKGVTFAACKNTMLVRNIKDEDLLPAARIIPSAAIELISKQEAGWAYFRGGK